MTHVEVTQYEATIKASPSPPAGRLRRTGGRCASLHQPTLRAGLHLASSPGSIDDLSVSGFSDALGFISGPGCRAPALGHLLLLE